MGREFDIEALRIHVRWYKYFGLQVCLEWRLNIELENVVKFSTGHVVMQRLGNANSCHGIDAAKYVDQLFVHEMGVLIVE